MKLFCSQFSRLVLYGKINKKASKILFLLTYYELTYEWPKRMMGNA